MLPYKDVTWNVLTAIILIVCIQNHKVTLCGGISRSQDELNFTDSQFKISKPCVSIFICLNYDSEPVNR